MTYLNDILDINFLAQLIKDGYISRNFHNDYPLAILNYSKLAQFDEKLVWNNEMNLSRGLIYNTDTMEVVAVPFRKFWNISDSRHPETMPENLPNEIPLFLEKLDGSLGILFEWDNLNHVATRGSFHSDQAVWATNWLRTTHPNLQLPKEGTILAEILYKQNKIVIDYDFEGLVVIGAINKATTKEMNRDDLKVYCRVMELNIVQEYKKSLNTCLSEDEKNREGYVLTYPSTGIKVKVKFETYCQLHKILTNLNAHSIWELLRDEKSQTISDWLKDENMPDTFKKWVKTVWFSLIGKFENILTEANHRYVSRPMTDPFMPYKESRKIMAQYFTLEENRKYSGLLFGMLDKKNIDKSIWKMIEPTGSDVFLVDGE